MGSGLGSVLVMYMCVMGIVEPSPKIRYRGWGGVKNVLCSCVVCGMCEGGGVGVNDAAFACVVLVGWWVV